MPVSGEITPFHWLTFAIACLGAAGTIANATWSVIQFRLNRHRVNIEARHGVVINTEDLTRANWSLSAHVNNIGRSAVTLRSIDIQPSESAAPAVSYTHWIGPKLAGYRLEAGAEGHWRIDDPAILQAMIDGGSGDGALCTFVLTLATGERIESEQIDIHPSGLDGLEMNLVPVKSTPPRMGE